MVLTPSALVSTFTRASLTRVVSPPAKVRVSAAKDSTALTGGVLGGVRRDNRDGGVREGQAQAHGVHDMSAVVVGAASRHPLDSDASSLSGPLDGARGQRGEHRVPGVMDLHHARDGSARDGLGTLLLPDVNDRLGLPGLGPDERRHDLDMPARQDGRQHARDDLREGLVRVRRCGSLLAGLCATGGSEQPCTLVTSARAVAIAMPSLSSPDAQASSISLTRSAAISAAASSFLDAGSRLSGGSLPSRGRTFLPGQACGRFIGLVAHKLVGEDAGTLRRCRCLPNGPMLTVSALLMRPTPETARPVRESTWDASVSLIWSHKWGLPAVGFADTLTS